MQRNYYSYKKTSGYKRFGEDWEIIHELNLESLARRDLENFYLKRILLIERRFVLETDEQRKADYGLILEDMRQRLKDEFAAHKDLNWIIHGCMVDLFNKRGLKLPVEPSS